MPSPKERVLDALSDAEQRSREKGGGSMRLKEEVIESMAKLVAEVEAEAIELVDRANGAVVRAVEAAYEDAVFSVSNLSSKASLDEVVRTIRSAKDDALRGTSKKTG